MSWLTKEDPAALATALATVALAVVTFFMGGATLLSAIFIGVQAWYTRKSLGETAEALRLTRLDSDRAAQLMTESQKARIDAEMPKLTLMAEEARPVFRRGSYNDFVVVQPMERLPDGSEEVLYFEFQVEAVNDGPRRTEVTFKFPSGLEPSARDRVLEEGQPTPIVGRRAETWQTWISLAQAWEADLAKGRLPDPTTILELKYTYPGDAGADEKHLVHMRGSIVRRASNGMGWELAPPQEYGSHMAFKILPFTRVYWSSRIRDRQID